MSDKTLQEMLERPESLIELRGVIEAHAVSEPGSRWLKHAVLRILEFLIDNDDGNNGIPIPVQSSIEFVSEPNPQPVLSGFEPARIIGTGNLAPVVPVADNPNLPTVPEEGIDTEHSSVRVVPASDMTPEQNEIIESAVNARLAKAPIVERFKPTRVDTNEG